MLVLLRILIFSICTISISHIFYNYTSYKLENFKSKNENNSVVLSSKERLKDLECLALNIYKEAGYEPFEGKVAVAQITLNRVESKDFPNSVCSVVYQKNKFNEKVICQFSWHCDAKHRIRPVGKDAYKESYEVAKKVLLENFRLPSLNQALYYHADYVNPNWKFERIIKIGKHIFYRPKN